MSKYANTARLSPDERLREVAAILATGILRLRQQAALLTGNRSETPESSSPDGLAVPRETRLSVRVGYPATIKPPIPGRLRSLSKSYCRTRLL
jgi:hypothetical protein